MHPILGRGERLALYLGLWVFAGLLLSGLLAEQHVFAWWLALAVALPLATVYAFVCLSAWYVSRGMPLASTTAIRIAVTALAASVISSAGWVALARSWIQFAARRAGVAEHPQALAGLNTLLFGLGILLYLLAIAFSYVFAVLEASQAAERRGLEVQVLAREAELRSLRAQIDPHFLFNSLHSISALTAVDPASARRMCLVLGDFLRESLALGSEERITVDRELSLVDRFLAIERIRFGDRLRADISAGDAGDCRVPPLLLQPIVENAVKHGVAHVLNGGTIRVAAARAGRSVRIVVENPCDPERPAGGGAGVGLANVRARLRTLHGTDAHLTAGETAGTWRVELVLPAVNHT